MYAEWKAKLLAYLRLAVNQKISGSPGPARKSIHCRSRSGGDLWATRRGIQILVCSISRSVGFLHHRPSILVGPQLPLGEWARGEPGRTGGARETKRAPAFGLGLGEARATRKARRKEWVRATVKPRCRDCTVCVASVATPPAGATGRKSICYMSDRKAAKRVRRGHTTWRRGDPWARNGV